MKIHKSVSILTLMLSLMFCNVVYPASIPNDTVLLIDNSGSMKKNDPFFLTKKAVTWFVENLPEDMQIEILIFDSDVKVAAPLTLATQTSKYEILANIDKIDYRGRFTNIPAAMERAIYDLKMEGRSKSQKSIIFITDGIVDTGDKARDMEKVRWLRENLSEDAAKSGIKIFGVALSDQADFELIQSLAIKTNGEYYRAFKADDIEKIFSKIIDSLLIEIQPEIVSAPPPPPTPTPPPTLIQPIVPSKVEDKGMPVLMIIQIALVCLLIIMIVVAASIILNKRRKATRVVSGFGPVVEESMPSVTLEDLSGVSGQSTYEIKEKTTMIGRLARSGGSIVNQIAINKDTISYQHAVIEYRDYSFRLRDQGSTNGTFVNKKRVTNEVRLKHGDIISFYKFEFRFVVNSIAQADHGELDKTVFAGSVDEDKTVIADMD